MAYKHTLHGERHCIHLHKVLAIKASAFEDLRPVADQGTVAQVMVGKQHCKHR
jgi:hypothetical protein